MSGPEKNTSVGHPGPLDDSREPLLPQGLSWDDPPTPPLFQFSLKAVFPLPPLPPVPLRVTPSAVLSPVPLAAPQAQDSRILSASLGLLTSGKPWVVAVSAPAAHISAPSVQDIRSSLLSVAEKQQSSQNPGVLGDLGFIPDVSLMSCVTR